MNAQQLADAAIERGQTFESMGTNKATDKDLHQYIEEIYHENDLQGEEMHDAQTIIFLKENALSLSEDEVFVLKLFLLNAWNTRGCMEFREMLNDEEKSEDWLNDVITDMTEKVKITPEETW